ncbi:MAG: 6-carboxytetrahydropterin synthase QueD [Candidatus Omnitrophota bacterium]|nr:6-carboxytetrahydropterin synthase QueD [Candidatus Omnitrophota bacterium]
MFELSVTGNISAAHYLKGYDGPCKNLHGHTWKVEAVLISDKLNSIGMVADFCTMKKKLKDCLSPLDHACLNDLDYFKNVNPTTEHIAKYIYQNFAKQMAPVNVKQVRVWESETSSVTYYE